jgi:adenine-specific DNA-methyltransferase
MPISKLRPSFTLTEDRLKELQAVVPEAFADGRINWDTLREALGETLEDESQEHFGLFWPGKREARRLAALPSKGTLIPQPGAGVDENSTHNLFIEGDNLEVLKLLQKSYAGRVKMIFIDPPYNTGGDFIYPDDYKEPLEVYLERTGQLDKTGVLLTTNTRASGRYHSNWLNMIYPRLILAKRLLRDDGVIFVSIDDHEVHNLRQVMDETFGAENFLAQIIWQKVYSPRMDDQGISPEHDYVLAYSCSEEFIPARMPFVQNAKQFTGLDEETGKNYRPRSLRKEGKNSRRIDRPNLYYPIKAPDGSMVYPIRSDGSEGCWRMQPETYEKMLASGQIEWVKVKGEWQAYVKQFYDENATRPYTTIWTHGEVGHNHEAVDEVKKLFGEPVFSNPKPTRLIRRMLNIASEFIGDDEIILDFFAGSATTAHAVLSQNREDGGKRRFILVQLPEPTDDKHKTISKISRERIKRVISQMKKEKHGKLNLSPNEDLGVRSFALDRSNYTDWQPFTGKDTSQLELRFGQAETPLVEGWTPENLLTEILLLQGFPLDSSVKALPEFKVNEVKLVTSEFVGHHLYVCLDKKVKAETVSKLSLRAEDIFVCLDSALSDEAKVKLADQCNLKVI